MFSKTARPLVTRRSSPTYLLEAREIYFEAGAIVSTFPISRTSLVTLILTAIRRKGDRG
jgi:hypothetical protein